MAVYESVTFTNMCMIYDGQGNVLVQDRVDPKWSGLTFPGGHVEKGESFTDAVIREIREETGLTVSDLEMCGVKDWFRDDGSRYVVLLYKTCRFSGTLISSDEGEMRWVPLEALKGMKMASSMESMLRVFLEDTLTEQFFESRDGKKIEWLK